MLFYGGADRDRMEWILQKQRKKLKLKGRAESPDYGERRCALRMPGWICYMTEGISLTNPFTEIFAGIA